MKTFDQVSPLSQWRDFQPIIAKQFIHRPLPNEITLQIDHRLPGPNYVCSEPSLIKRNFSIYRDDP